MVKKIDEIDQKVQTATYKINMSVECTKQHGEHSNNIVITLWGDGG